MTERREMIEKQKLPGEASPGTFYPNLCVCSSVYGSYSTVWFSPHLRNQPAVQQCLLVLSFSHC